jgi:energy-converting hydrogenase Eha subunit C
VKLELREMLDVRERPLLGVCIGCFLLGSAIMVAFEAPLARIVGVALLFGFIVSGVFLVADPEFLDRDEE